MGSPDYPDVLSVSTASSPPHYLTISLRYLTLFAIYTPYTIHKCK